MFCHAYKSLIDAIGAAANGLGTSHGTPGPVASNQFAASCINSCTINNIRCWNLCTPHRNTVPPPQLATDAPIADVLMPVLESLCVARREEGDFTIANCCCATGRAACSRTMTTGTAITLRRIHSAQRRTPQTVVGDTDVPLFAQVWLHWNMASIAMTNTVAIRLHALKQPVSLEPCNNGCTCIFTRETNECTRFGRYIFPTVTIRY